MIELFGSFVHWFLSYWTANTMHGMQHITLKIYTNTVTYIRAHARRIPRMPQQIEQTLTNLLEWDWNCGELNSSAAATLSHGEQIQTDDHTVLFVIPSLLMCVRLHCCATAAATTATSFSLCLFCFCFPQLITVLNDYLLLLLLLPPPQPPPLLRLLLLFLLCFFVLLLVYLWYTFSCEYAFHVSHCIR